MQVHAINVQYLLKFDWGLHQYLLCPITFWNPSLWMNTTCSYFDIQNCGIAWSKALGGGIVRDFSYGIWCFCWWLTNWTVKRVWCLLKILIRHHILFSFLLLFNFYHWQGREFATVYSVHRRLCTFVYYMLNKHYKSSKIQYI